MSQPLIMSFRSEAAAMCLDGRKTQTRRIWTDGYQRRGIFDPMTLRVINPFIQIVDKPWTDRQRILWTVGESIAIKPSRIKKAVGRVMCTGLRVERVQDITEEDARREGAPTEMPVKYFGISTMPCTPKEGFSMVWHHLYPTGPRSWDANPLVVVIEFRPLREGEK